MLQLTGLELKNWKNFKNAKIELGKRLFIVGPNASGKSNLLDAFRFLRDIVKPGGGLQKAVDDRGGMSKIRCLHAREDTVVFIRVTLEDKEEGEKWEYTLAFNLKSQFPPSSIIKQEEVIKNGNSLFTRPSPKDKVDDELLKQTHLEQVSANKDFRKLAEYFGSFKYLHLVPQLIRFAGAFQGTGIPEDPFGQSFLQTLKKTQERTRKSRLRKISEALSRIVNLRDLELVDDEMGVPHLKVLCEHWRPNAGKQNEDQLSDGTLRFIGLLWSILDAPTVLVLEEPELSLHDAVVAKLPSLMGRLQKDRTQIVVSTHSISILSDKGIGAEEVVLLRPDAEGTRVDSAVSIEEIASLMQEGMSAADAVIPHTRPHGIEQLELFDAQ